MTGEELVTRDMTIGDITEKYPQTAEIFMEYGLHCVGCHVAFWETLEEGARGHGMEEETIDCMIRDANTIANESGEAQSKEPKLNITTDALNLIKQMIKEQNKFGHVFRIAVTDDGYAFTLEQEPRETDEFISEGEVLIVVDKVSIEKLVGKTVDVAYSEFKIL